MEDVTKNVKEETMNRAEQDAADQAQKDVVSKEDVVEVPEEHVVIEALENATMLARLRQELR